MDAAMFSIDAKAVATLAPSQHRVHTPQRLLSLGQLGIHRLQHRVHSTRN